MAGPVAGPLGHRPDHLFDAGALPVRVAGEIKGFEATRYIDRKQVRRMSRTTHLAIAAATMALHDTQLDMTKFDPYCIGVSLGAGVAGLDKTVEGAMSIADQPATDPRRLARSNGLRSA